MSGPSELAKAKLKVMEAVPYIQKERKQGLTYSFAGEAAILEKLHPAFQEAGLAWAVTGCTLIAQEQYTTKNNAAMNRVIVQATYTLTHAESGQSETVQALGEGSDHGDKATSKAMTSALKYALRQTFLIETGDDPDHTSSDQQERGQQRPVQQQQPAKTQQPNGQQAAPAKAKKEAATVAELFASMDAVKRPPKDGAELVAWLKSAEVQLRRLVPDYHPAELFDAVAGFLRVDGLNGVAVVDLARDLGDGWNRAKEFVKACEQPAGVK